MENGKYKYEWHMLVSVSWLMAVVALISLMALPGDVGPSRDSPPWLMIFPIGALAVLVISLFRLPSLLEGREGMKVFTIVSLLVGIASASFMMLT